MAMAAALPARLPALAVHRGRRASGPSEPTADTASMMNTAAMWRGRL